MSPLCRNCDSFARRPGLRARLSILVELAGTATKVASVDDALTLIRANGGRVTTPRRLLLEVLFETDQHLSAEELANAVHTRAPEVHLSTIYRNVEDLQRLGVIAHSHIGHGAITYQLAALSHAHFLCERCGTTIEAPDEMFRGLARSARSRLGFSIDPHHFAIQGRCAACSEMPASPRSIDSAK